MLKFNIVSLPFFLAWEQTKIYLLNYAHPLT